MCGNSHTEIACFKVLGDLLRDGGWVEASSKADVATPETAKSSVPSSNTSKLD